MAPREGRPFVSLRSVSKAFGSHDAVVDLDLDIGDGELFVLLGPSGCGKSTTLNLIAGFLTPDAGDVMIRSESVAGLPVYRRNIGMVFQSYSLFPHLTVLQNTMFGLRRRKIPTDEAKAAAGEKLAVVGMGGYEDRYPDQLSGGQQQRVALARALVIRPQLLLLDEPLSNLDARLRIEMREEIRSLVSLEQVTTLFVTHDQEEALSIADRIGVMHAGTLLQVGTPVEIYQTPEDLRVADFVGRSNRLRGIVASTLGDFVEVRLASGAVVEGTAVGDLSEGTPVITMVRPEAFSLGTADPERTNSVEADMIHATFLGQRVEVLLRLGEEGIRASFGVDDVGSLAEGEKCRLSWSRHRMRVYPDGGVPPR